MWPERYSLIIIDVLKPTLNFSTLSPRFINIIENEKREVIGLNAGVRVPDYKKALNYYLEEHPQKNYDIDYKNSPSSERIKIAYTYLWQQCQYEISTKASEELLLLLRNCFQELQIDLDEYKSIKKWIVNERERIFKRPSNGGEIIAFVKFLDDSDHILALLSCLELVCQIIEEAPSLISNCINVLNKSIGNNINNSNFDAYVKVSYRKQLIPYLVKKYTNMKPRSLVPMLYALEEIGLLTSKVSSMNQTTLHIALQGTFGNVGARTTLTTSLNLYHIDPSRPDPSRRQGIEIHKKEIESFLKDSTE